MSSFPRASPSRTLLPVSITNSPPSLDTISSSRSRAATITTSPTPLHHNDRLVSTTPPLSTTPTPSNDPIFTTPPPPNDPVSTTPTCPNGRLLSASPWSLPTLNPTTIDTTPTTIETPPTTIDTTPTTIETIATTTDTTRTTRETVPYNADNITFAPSASPPPSGSTPTNTDITFAPSASPPPSGSTPTTIETTLTPSSAPPPSGSTPTTIETTPTPSSSPPPSGSTPTTIETTPTPSSSPPPSGSSPPGTSKSSPPLSPSTTPSPRPSSSGMSTGLVAGIVIGGVVILAILSILFIWCKKKKRRDHDDYVPPSHGPTGFAKSTFSYDELAMATDAFSEANLLGQGGFGYVYKGVLPSGKEVAVKQLKAGSGQGEREFQAEVEIISRVHHKHLVSLVGYCITGSQRMLVYEFVPNNTLEFHLHGEGRPTMDWSTRLRIALGSAKGLAYLHEDCHPKIIHRDIKAANILLDFHFEAMVADFGVAKLCSDVDTHISTRVMGAFGYLAPEYASSGKLTHKSDVFSFGVVLLELITGRRPVNSSQSYADDSLVDWAQPLLTQALEDGNFDTLLDPQLQRDYRPNEMARMVACAAACVRHSARCRPRMSQVVRAFEGDVSLSDLNEGIKPGHNTVYSSRGISDYDTSQYNEDMKKFRKMALGTREYESNEYSALTSESGLYPSSTSSGGQQTT